MQVGENFPKVWSENFLMYTKLGNVWKFDNGRVQDNLEDKQETEKISSLRRLREGTADWLAVKI